MTVKRDFTSIAEYTLLGEIGYGNFTNAIKPQVDVYDSKQLRADEVSAVTRLNKEGVNDGAPAIGLGDRQAADFAARFDILAYQPETSSGFSATLLFDKQKQEYVLSTRGTNGILNDGLQADLAGIAFSGLATRQLRDLHNFVEQIKSPKGQPILEARLPLPSSEDPLDRNNNPDRIAFGVSTHLKGLSVLPAGAKLIVTGHSLGGHLAMSTERMYPELVSAVYVNNAAGFGSEHSIKPFFDKLAQKDTHFNPSKYVDVYGNDGARIIANNVPVLGMPHPGKMTPIDIEGSSHSSKQTTLGTQVAATLDRFSKQPLNAEQMLKITQSASLGDNEATFERSLNPLLKLQNIHWGQDGKGALAQLDPNMDSTSPTGRDTLYNVQKALEASAKDQYTFVPLSELGREELAKRATVQGAEGAPYRFALANGYGYAVIAKDNAQTYGQPHVQTPSIALDAEHPASYWHKKAGSINAPAIAYQESLQNLGATLKQELNHKIPDNNRGTDSIIALDAALKAYAKANGLPDSHQHNASYIDDVLRDLRKQDPALAKEMDQDKLAMAQITGTTTKLIKEGQDIQAYKNTPNKELLDLSPGQVATHPDRPAAPAAVTAPAPSQYDPSYKMVWIPADGTPSPKGLSPNGMPLGENSHGMAQGMDGKFDKINGWAVKQADGSYLETQFKLDAQNQVIWHKAELLNSKGVLQKSVYEIDDVQQINTFDKHGKAELYVEYKKAQDGSWQLDAVTGKNGKYSEKELDAFKENNSHDKMSNTSSLKQAGLDPMDQLPENVRKVATLLEENHLGKKLAEKGLSPEEIQNACVALAGRVGQCPGRHPKEILMAFVDTRGDLQAITGERYSPSVPLETAKTQTFEQSVATMDQAVEQRQQQAMERSQNQSQGQALSMGGHRMV